MTHATANSTVLALREAQVVYSTGITGMHPTDIEFDAGGFVVLLGPSGAGKSTMLRALNGLVPLTAGSLHAEGGTPIMGATSLRQHRRKTAMVFQQHQLIGRLTALDNVLTGRLGHHHGLRTLLPLPRHDRLIALGALEQVQLLEYALTRADRLSGGQQQRVGLARALAQEPRIILADEPVASLDPASARHALSLIHAVCKAQGIAAVVSLHQVDLARSFADRIVGVRAGRVVFDGRPENLDDSTVRHIYATANHPVVPTASVLLAA